MLKTSFNEEWGSCARAIRKSEDRTNLSALGFHCCVFFSLDHLCQVQLCAGFTAVFWGSIRWKVGELHAWSMRFNTWVPPVSSLSMQQGVLCSFQSLNTYLRSLWGNIPVQTHHWAPSVAAEELGTVSFPGHSLKLCFLPVEVLAWDTQQHTTVGAVM